MWGETWVYSLGFDILKNVTEVFFHYLHRKSDFWRCWKVFWCRFSLNVFFSVLWGRSAALAAGYLTRVKSQKLLAGRSECGWKDGRGWQMFSGQRQRSGEDHRSVVLHTTGVWIFCINTDFCIFWPLRDNPCDSRRSDFSFLSVTAWGFKSCLKLLPK